MIDLPDLFALNMPAPTDLDAEATLAIYQALRPLLPPARPAANRKTDRLVDCLEAYEAFILDGFGVINVGMDKIDGIDEFFSLAKQKNKPVVILTNGASNPSHKIAEKYLNWGLPISREQIISSRDALAAALPAPADRAGLLQLDDTTHGLESVSLLTADKPHCLAVADGFVFMGSTAWTQADQARLEDSLLENLRPVLVGNPDVSAPHPAQFSAEPGYWMARAMQKVRGLRPRWFGKPHPAAFRLAIERINRLAGHEVRLDKIAMVGDSPHTDILGGAACGLGTILITAYGLLRDHDAEQVCTNIGIQPDWQVRRL